MLRAVDQWTEARMASLRGGSKITPSPKMPQIVVIADEVADVFGSETPRKEQTEGASNTVMAHLGTRLTRKGRSEAFQGVYATQRATVTMTGGGDLKSQCNLRFGLGTVSEADAASIIPDDSRTAKLISRMRHSGTGIVWRKGTPKPMPVKFWRLDPDIERHPEDMEKILRLAQRAGRNRPAPEKLGLDVMGADYNDRWERSEMYERLVELRDGAGQGQAAAPSNPAPAAGGAPAATIEITEDDVREKFAAITGDPEFATLADKAPQDVPAWKLKIYAYLAGFPTWGLPVADLVTKLRRDGFDPHPVRETVNKWLRDEAKSPTGTISANDSHRYFLRRDRPWAGPPAD
jgi:hypothetical protein